MRILFFGTAEFAVPALERLARSGEHEVLAVISQPDKPHGRGLQVTVSPVKRAAERLGMNLLQPKRVRSETFISRARELNPDALVLAAFGQIIPQSLLDIPPKGPINIHGSLLPAYRGAAPIQHAILNGETVTGVTTMWMDATLDTGDILLTRAVQIDDEDTTGTLTPRLAEAGAELIQETLRCLESADCPRTPQDESRATFAPPIKPNDSMIRWEESALRTRNRVRALSPRPGAFASFRGRRLKVWMVSAEEGRADPGEVIRTDRHAIHVGTGVGLVNLLEVQPENSRRMTGPEWARGVRLTPGDRFDRPA